MHFSDESLVAQVLNGNPEAFEDLVSRYQKPVFKVAYRMVGHHQEAEDLAQEIFVHVYQKINRFDTSKKFAPWLYKVAANLCISRIRRRQKVSFLPFDDKLLDQVELDYPSHHKPDVKLEIEELRSSIGEILLKLPEKYRAMIILRYQLDLNNKEIAEALGITRENVEVRMHRAHKSLRSMMHPKLSEMGDKCEL